MSRFIPQEIAYLRGQPLGRLGTVNARGELHLVPVGFAYNAEHDSIDVGGRRPGFGASRKFRDVQQTGRVVFLVDDVFTTGQTGQERQLRAIEIRGTGEAHERGGERIGASFEL